MDANQLQQVGLFLNGTVIAGLVAVAEIGRRLLRKESQCQRRLRSLAVRITKLEENAGSRHAENIARLESLSERMPPAQ